MYWTKSLFFGILTLGTVILLPSAAPKVEAAASASDIALQVQFGGGYYRHNYWRPYGFYGGDYYRYPGYYRHYAPYRTYPYYRGYNNYYYGYPSYYYYNDPYRSWYGKPRSGLYFQF